LEALPGEGNICARHLHKVAVLASGLVVANVMAHLRGIVNVRDVVCDSFQIAAEVLDVAIGDLEKEEGFNTFGKAIKQNVSLDILEIECRHFGLW
jgi:hypothetical protein